MTENLDYLVGKEPRKIDSKYRVAIPSKIWKGDNEDYIYIRLNKNSDDYLDIIPRPYFDKFFLLFYNNLNIDNPKEEELFRLLSKQNLDNQNRIIIPPEFRNRINLGDQVSFIGIGNAIRLRF